MEPAQSPMQGSDSQLNPLPGASSPRMDDNDASQRESSALLKEKQPDIEKEENWSPEESKKRKYSLKRKPAIILIGQTILLIFGWTFFGVTRNRPVALPDAAAEWVRDHAQSVTMISTLVASALSILSGFLYSRAIRFSLATFLTWPVSLYTIAAAIKVATKSPIYNFARLEWTIAAIICSLAVSAQTAGWSTLLTPKRIQLTAPMHGFELDLSSDAFVRLALDNRDRVNADLLTSVVPVIGASGATAVGSQYNLPSILNFNKLSYVNSTGGILPANYVPISSAAGTSPTTVLPANTEIENLSHHPEGFQSKYTMSQQGFTANVTCQQRDLNNTTSPSLEVLSRVETVFDTSITLAQLRVVCPGSSNASLTHPILTSPGIDTVMGLPCVTKSSNGTDQHDLVIVGLGIYGLIKPTVCTIRPKVTVIGVDYNDATKFFNSSFPSFINSSQPMSETDAPWIGDYSLAILLRSLEVSQSLTGNSVGDTISSFANMVSEQNAVGDILEGYIRGVLEFSVTLLRTVYTQSDNNLFPGNNSTIPESMRRTTNGTFYMETIGWYQDTTTAPGVLFAPSFVALVTISVILVTLIRTRGPIHPEGNLKFDPGKVLHVVGAASAGGLEVPFPGFEDDAVKFSQGVLVRLGPLDNGKTGLIG